MQLVPWGEYKPDVADLVGNHTRVITNVVPRADGYGPIRNVEAYSAALGAACRGAFRALNADGTITVFAATSSTLYKMSNIDLTFEVVSKTAGAYSYNLPDDQQWQFAQYDDYVIAVQGGDDVQVYELGVSTYFADLGGSPPRAKYVSVVNEFIVLTGLVSFPYRMQWSGRSAPTTWTSGTSESDFNDFVDGGPLGPMGGGELTAILLQTTAMRRMTYQPGSAVIFSFDRISEDIGILAPYSLVKSGQRLFFLSNAGFQMSTDGSVPVPIGKERIDNTFTSEWDDDNLQLTLGFTDPRGTRVFWAYKTIGADTGLFNKVLCYDWVLDRWTPIDGYVGEYVTSLAQVGQTLEGLDDLSSVSVTGDTTSGNAVISDVQPNTTGIYAGMWITGTGIPASTTVLSVDSSSQITLSANATATNGNTSLTLGGSLDSLNVSSLDAFPVAYGKEVAIFTSAHTMGFLTGDYLEATLETPEQGEGGMQQFISGCYPVSDADSIYGQVSSRQNPAATRVWNMEQQRDSAGLIPARVDTRFTRYRNRIPAGAVWTYSSGVMPITTRTGNR